ncbi:cora-like Mg2+ transporter protein-domain-containing protein [Chytriomyces sp. MP71]|nr:cora-like Mg2+ transporter protein-domain-containing protein [Chytriomyces sp. MP71]
MTVLEELGAMEGTAEGLIDLTFNMLSFQTNENMKLLSVVSAVFLPISFVAGVFGMNFVFFPELQFEMGVFYFWGWVSLITVLTLFITKKMGMLESVQ